MNKNSKTSKFHAVTTFLSSFCFLAIGLSISAALLFSGIKLMIANYAIADVLNIRTVLHIDWGYYGYDFWQIDENPYPYLLSIVLVSAIFGALWITFITPKSTRHFIYHILAIPWISLVITESYLGYHLVS